MAIKTKKKDKSLVKVGILIKTERKNKGYSLAKLSDLAFGNENYATTISLIERGMRDTVHFTTIVKILKALEFEIF